jgi:hypothetical protein
VVIEHERVPGAEETFPFASWSLFSKVPAVVDDYGLLLTEIDGQPLSPPILYEHSREWFWAANNHGAYCAILDFGRAVDAGDAAESQRRRRLFERLYLGNGKVSVEYQLLRRRWEPMSRWRTGEFIELEVLGHHDLARRSGAAPAELAAASPEREAD